MGSEFWMRRGPPLPAIRGADPHQYGNHMSIVPPASSSNTMSRPNSPPQAAAILDEIFKSSAFEMPPHEKALTQLLRDLHAALVAFSGAAA